MQPEILIHDSRDTVGVAVVDGLDGGRPLTAWSMDTDQTASITAKEPIALGHKVALIDHAVGDTVIKYGHDIGVVVEPIGEGEHVHVHNVRTKRW